NYLIGTGDQINIDLYGYSDANFKLKVSPEGTIRIPNSGPVKIAGLSFDDAQQKIKSQLTKIYPQIASGKTSVQVSLGQIRSIRVTLVGEIQQPGTYTLP
ncbi:polysaccharide biosynthesis/export family protein, partial [Acinetobacter baumannii]